MLQAGSVYAVVPTKNMEASKAFFKDVLGLEALPEKMPNVALYKCGDGMVQLYETQYAGTNQATTMGWSVQDFDETVEELKSRGVVFEEYDFPGFKTENGVMDMGGFKAAWFKDPEGNILCVSTADKN